MNKPVRVRTDVREKEFSREREREMSAAGGIGPRGARGTSAQRRYTMQARKAKGGGGGEIQPKSAVKAHL